MTTPSVCVLLLGALCGGDPLAPLDKPTVAPTAHGRPCHYPDEMWRPSLQQCVLKSERERPYRHDPRRVRVPHVASHTYKRHRQHERKGRVIAADPSKEDRVIVHDPSRPSFFEEELIRKDEQTKRLFIERFKGREP